MRILFQGDSITDAGRDHRNFYDLGRGYPRYAAEGLRVACPDAAPALSARRTRRP